MTKKEFYEKTKYLWNEVVNISGINIATVKWHDKPWKLDCQDNFDEVINNRDGFETKEELWKAFKLLTK